MAVVARHAKPERKADPRLGHFGCLLFGIDTRGKDLHAEIGERLLLLFEGGQLAPTEGSPESAIKDGDSEVGIQILRKSHLSTPHELQANLWKEVAGLELLSHGLLLRVSGECTSSFPQGRGTNRTRVSKPRVSFDWGLSAQTTRDRLVFLRRHSLTEANEIPVDFAALGDCFETIIVRDLCEYARSCQGLIR